MVEKIANALNVSKQELLGISEKKEKQGNEIWKDATFAALQSEINFLREIVKNLTGKNAPTNFLMNLNFYCSYLIFQCL